MTSADKLPSDSAMEARAEVVTLTPRRDLFLDDALSSVESRALAYLDAGAAVHLRGPAGAGKSTLARHVAARLGRPAVLLSGDGWNTAATLLGDHTGQRTDSVHDRFIHSVTKKTSATTAIWEDAALTIAMEHGYTLVYDEFTRSPPEANNPLLAALEEGEIVLATHARGERVVKAHPEFRAIFTSNPSDYAAVNAPQDALLDRMITFDLAYHGPETETGIVAVRSGLGVEEAARVVALVRALRAEGGLKNPPSMRSAILIARVMARQNLRATVADDGFIQLCFDALESRAPSEEAEGDVRAAYFETLRKALLRTCPPRAAAAPTKIDNAADADAADIDTADLDAPDLDAPVAEAPLGEAAA